MENRSKINDMQVRRIVSRYELNELLGQGAYSQVFKARHLDTAALYAVKVISNKVLSQNEKVKECINNQLSVHHILQPSPHIVRFFELLQTKNNCYFVYEYCEGGTLHDLLQKEGKLEEKRALQIFSQIIDGLRVLRKHNIIHRDLKPENLLISQGVFKLADFGFCKQLADNQMTKTMLGSPLYMAPEVLKGESYSANADIWSLGVILYEMIQGKCPFWSSSIANLISAIEQYPLLFDSSISMSPKIKRFILKCLQKESKHRMSWEELFQQVIHLNQIHDSLAVSLQSFPFLHHSNAIQKEMHSTLNVQQPSKRSNYELFKQNYNKQTKKQHKQEHVFTNKENTKPRTKSLAKNDLVKSKGRESKIGFSQLLLQHQQCLNALRICMEILQNHDQKHIAQVGSVLKGIRKILERIYSRINLEDVEMLPVLSMVKYEMIQVQKMQGDIQKWTGQASDDPDCSTLPSVLAEPWTLLSNYC